MPPDQGDHTLTIWLRDRVVDFDVNILWTQKIGRSWWGSGGHLMITPWESMRLWWDRIRQQADNRREATRHTFSQCFLVSVDGGIENRWESGPPNREAISLVSLDISLGGIRFVSGEPFASAGRTLSISRENRPDEPAVQGIVRFVSEMKNGYCSTGVEFCE